jgi:glycosyltransferase involved in cell wall biosynthesis
VAHALWRGLAIPRRKLLVTDLAAAPVATFTSEERAGLADRAIVPYPVDEKRAHRDAYDLRRALTLIAETRPAAILFHDSRALESMLALKRAARMTGVPFNATEHLVTPDFGRVPLAGRPRDRDWPRRARHVIFVSEDNRVRFLAERPDAAGKAFVAPNGVLPSAGTWPDPAAAARLRALAGWEGSEPIVAVLARISAEKGQDLAIRACAAAARPWRLALIGPDPDGLAPALRETAAALGVGERIAFLGRREDARDLIRGAAALLVPSRTEGLPLSVLEAMAEGVPVVAAAVGGVPEALGEAAAGLVDPRGLTDTAIAGALAARLDALFTDELASRRASGAGRARVAERYSLDGMLAAHGRWLAELEAEIEAGDPAPRARRLLRRCAPPSGYRAGLNSPAAWNLLREGFSAPQSWGAMAHDRARVELPIPTKSQSQESNPSRRVRVTLEIVTPGRRPGRLVAVSGPGGFAARWRFAGVARRFTKTFEVEAAPGEDAVALEFVLAERGLGGERDVDGEGRCAALGLATVEVRPALSPTRHGVEDDLYDPCSESLTPGP